MGKQSKKRYVEIPAARLVAELETIGRGVAEQGGAYSWRVQGRERVFDLSPATPAGDRRIPGQIRIFTSLSVGADTVRACDTDAIRIVVGALEVHPDGCRVEAPGTGWLVRPDLDQRAKRFRPVEKGVKILRTAPRGVEDRVGVFLNRFRGALRDAYRRARAVRSCSDCGGLMAHREGRNGPFLGCLNYPECRHTERVSA